jgi:peptide chain release factor 1
MIKVMDADLKIEWYSGTGAGGQHRNKHQNSCRITHIPTGTLTTAQCRSRQNSYNEARAEIERRIVDQIKIKVDSDISENRRQQVGSGMRGDKIRTYRFQDDRVQDHITGKIASTKKVLQGNFDLMWLTTG